MFGEIRGSAVYFKMKMLALEGQMGFSDKLLAEWYPHNTDKEKE